MVSLAEFNSVYLNKILLINELCFKYYHNLDMHY